MASVKSLPEKCSACKKSLMVKGVKSVANREMRGPNYDCGKCKKKNICPGCWSKHKC